MDAQRRAEVVVYALHLPMTGPGRNRQWLRLSRFKRMRAQCCSRSRCRGSSVGGAGAPVPSSMQRAWCMSQRAAGARCRPCGMPIE
ncbi:hypothetical protein HZS92_01761 [Xanthomonas citri pv. citri]|nr:hypothetical protein HZS91_01796 [Xanthomonas citri pv. citri]QYF39696.1 hypothetical protein HZS92_01761 [Xanthomonas citri pv. citri]QYF44473.1 hypothetical protein HZS93_01762 [Xanthomonas citri]CCF67302.1 putative uncharacterized protein [Xanthomonas citri pv. punicae str. LMG 859]